MAPIEAAAPVRPAVSPRRHQAASATGAAMPSIATKTERQPKFASRKPPTSGATIGETTIAMVM